MLLPRPYHLKGGIFPAILALRLGGFLGKGRLHLHFGTGLRRPLHPNFSRVKIQGPWLFWTNKLKKVTKHHWIMPAVTFLLPQHATTKNWGQFASASPGKTEVCSGVSWFLNLGWTRADKNVSCVCTWEATVFFITNMRFPTEQIGMIWLEFHQHPVDTSFLICTCEPVRLTRRRKCRKTWEASRGWRDLLFRDRGNWWLDFVNMMSNSISEGHDPGTCWASQSKKIPSPLIQST